MTSFAKIVGSTMHDHSSTKHAMSTKKLDLMIDQGALRVSLRIRRKVAKISDVAIIVRRSAMLFLKGVD